MKYASAKYLVQLKYYVRGENKMKSSKNVAHIFAAYSDNFKI